MKKKNSARFKLLSYDAVDGSARAGLLVDGQVYDLAMTMKAAGWKHDFQPDSVISVLHDWNLARPQIDLAVESILSARANFEKIRRPLAEVKIRAPTLYPGVLYCAGANYRDHFLEMTGKSAGKKDRQPFFFLKTVAGTIIGPGEAVRLPSYSSKVDWEAEIALVVGRAGKNIPAERAMDYVAGFTILNDLSARDLTKRDDVPFVFDWIGQKCFDTAAPMGPWITPTDAIPDPNDMAIRLWVNGELKQNSNSGQQIFSFNEQIAYLSHHVTLFPGDVIATGTPAGVGMAKGEFLKPGDQIKIEVEGLGVLVNPVVADNEE